jgi:hypothetical protein
MLLVKTQIRGIHQGSPTTAPLSLRDVNSWLSFSTREAISCVVVIQIRPIIGSLTSTTGPAARILLTPAIGSWKTSWLAKFIGFGQHNQAAGFSYQCNIHLDLIAKDGLVWVDGEAEDCCGVFTSDGLRPFPSPG